jgi:predicted anti-sigma-YlaC factor YlaD
MTSPTCREIQPELSLLVDSRLRAEVEVRVREHLGSCPACRGVLADLDRLRRATREIAPIAPPDHVWLQVAGNLRTTTAPATAARHVARAPIWQWAGLAAALVLVTAALYLLQRIETVAPAGPGQAENAAPAGSVEAVADELNLAAAHYERALAELEAMAKASGSPMDETVVSDVRVSLGAIDLAIAESRAALASNPLSEPARDSLFDALRRKITVLQTTVSLINEMRAGDPEGAQRAAETLGKKS